MYCRSADKTSPWTWRMSARSELSWRLAWSAIFFLSRWISQRRSEMMLVYWAMWYDTFIKFFFTWRAWWEIENNKVFDTENVFVCFPFLLVPVGVAAVDHSQPMWFGTSFLLQQFVPLNISSANDCSTSWAMVAPETTYKLPLIHRIHTAQEKMRTKLQTLWLADDWLYFQNYNKYYDYTWICYIGNKWVVISCSNLLFLTMITAKATVLKHVTSVHREHMEAKRWPVSWAHPCSNAFGTVSVRQRVTRLLKSHRGGANMGYHDSSAVPAQWVLSITAIRRKTIHK